MQVQPRPLPSQDAPEWKALPSLFKTIFRMKSKLTGKQRKQVLELMQNKVRSSKTYYEVSKQKATPGPDKKTVLLHGSMYLLSLLGEIFQLRNQYNENKYPVFYFSVAIQTCELFIEFILQLLNRQSDYLIMLMEFVKSLTKFREYRMLTTKENIKLFIEQSEYHEHKENREIKMTHYTLKSQQSQACRIKNFRINPKLKEIRNQTLTYNGPALDAEYDSANSQEVAANQISGQIQTAIQSQRTNPEDKNFVLKFLQALANWVQSFSYQPDDIIFIFRPVVYMWLVTQRGQKSWQPLKISFFLDCISGVFSLLRTFQTKQAQSFRKGRLQVKEKYRLRGFEKKHLNHRYQLLALKYLLREPIFSQYTMPYLKKIAGLLHLPQVLIDLITSILDYYRYYSYIA